MTRRTIFVLGALPLVAHGDDLVAPKSVNSELSSDPIVSGPILTSWCMTLSARIALMRRLLREPHDHQFETTTITLIQDDIRLMQLVCAKGDPQELFDVPPGTKELALEETRVRHLGLLGAMSSILDGFYEGLPSGSEADDRLKLLGDFIQMNQLSTRSAVSADGGRTTRADKTPAAQSSAKP